MTTLIIEDEALAAERLADLIRQYDPAIEITACLDSVREAVEWFGNNPAPDLAFFDIQLADGLSFDIFEKTEVPCPVIFTTAYDKYALKAFKVHSIDYLLKPVGAEELSAAFEQYYKINKNMAAAPSLPNIDLIRQAINRMSKKYKTRFIVKAGHHISSVATADILYFYTEHRTTWIKTKALKKHAIDYTLEQLTGLLDPEQFFRINRKYIVSIDAIDSATGYSNSRLKVQFTGGGKKEKILISRERVREFKEWLDK
ncbi:MAG TPA: response regulator transcription factor [Bacteroidetes bacterium]|nr:response regulator transcription factor [Bacteroidota bacterium]